jgi:signal transduction histidine kinase
LYQTFFFLLAFSAAYAIIAYLGLGKRMIDKAALDNLGKEEKTALKDSLEEIIERTYDLEREYKMLQKSVIGFQELVSQLVESQPNPMWIVDHEEHHTIFFQNSASKLYNDLIDYIDMEKEIQEIEYEQSVLLVKLSTVTGDHTKRIISATDITEQKRSERLASMGQIAAHLAHEIRNPIGSISLLASTLLKRVDTRQKPLVEEIKSAIARVERIIKSTLLFTKGVHIDKKDLSLKRLEEELYNAFASYAYTKEIELKIDFNALQIKGDYDLLTIVLQNFLYNSIDAIEESDEEEGKIHLSAKEEPDAVVLTITDTGVPIENENILYEPFKTTKTKGHGLGLALSLEIIKAHNGTISLLHETKGFKIYLPRE